MDTSTISDSLGDVVGGGEKNDDFWKKYFSSYDLLNHVIPYKKLIEEFATALIGVEGSIFDAGSGTGNFEAGLRMRGITNSIVSMDLSSVGVKMHRKKVAGSNVIQGDITEKLPFGEDSFGAVLCNNVLYTIDSSKYEAIFREFFRILRSGGKLVISNPLINARYLPILRLHVQESIRRIGVLSTLFSLTEAIPSIVKLLLYNKRIINRAMQKQYHFFCQGEQRRLAESVGFLVTHEMRVYADQNELIVARKSE